MSARAPRWWEPEAFRARRRHLEDRQKALRAVRRFFEERGFAEVETPALQVSPGLEPHLAALAVELHCPDRMRTRTLYLHTSPEFAMKKLLVAGEPRLFQLCKVFRDAERASTHHPEFTMLEWYRARAGYRDAMADCEGVVRAVFAAAGRDRCAWRGAEADPFAAWEYLSVDEAFRRHAGIELESVADSDSHDPDPDPLAAAARRIGVNAREGDRWEDVFFRIFLERIEPRLGRRRPTILYDYPIAMAALARAKPDDPLRAERFELYLCGLELANGFGELIDARIQRARFAAEVALKERLYGLAYPVDEDFLAALEHGMPESAGVALGFDRLAMLVSGAERIEDVLWAPVADLDS
ncbi:MAG: EF-P lysine aminoacylase EpmA [Alphaproteobacteria bacterium]